MASFCSKFETERFRGPSPSHVHLVRMIRVIGQDEALESWGTLDGFEHAFLNQFCKRQDEQIRR